MKEALESAIQEKWEIEEELSNWNREMYEMNERMLLMEINNSTLLQKS